MALIWTAHVEGGPRRVNHAAALVGNVIYSFGGYCTGDNFRKLSPMDVHILCTVTNRWKKLATPTGSDLRFVPFQRYGHTAVGHGDNIYIWGGRNDEAACNTLYCFNTNTCKWSCPAVSGSVPGARDGHTACVIDSQMYVFGGFVDDIDEYAEGLHALDLDTFRWSFIYATGVPPPYRDFHSATALNGKMYIFGGRGDVNSPFHTQNEIYDNMLFEFDPSKSQWSNKGSPERAPKGRRSHTTFSHGNRLYLFGGFNANLRRHFNDLYYFDTVSEEWSSELYTLGERPCRRRRHSSVIVGNRMFLFGGTSPCDTAPMADSDEEDTDEENKLMDHSDLFILDLGVTLRTLCIAAVMRYHVSTLDLPLSIRQEISWMTKPNNLTRPLPRPSTG